MKQAGATIGWVAIVRRAILDSAESSEFHEDDNPDVNDSEVRAQPESIVEPEISADEGLTASMGKLGVHELTTDQNIHAAQPIIESPKRDYNILLVVARPSKEEDINPLLGARAIFGALEGLAAVSTVKVNVEIARPGTWDAFVDHIESRTRAWHAEGGKGAWFDVVHFDVHGVVRNGVASLLFLSSKGTHALKRPAEMIGALLKENHVRFAVLNSCDSANQNPRWWAESRISLSSNGISFGLQSQTS
jgi:hypothetical protein